MRLLLDTHLLLWTASASQRLSSRARILMQDPDNELLFSAASIWEVAIKASLNRRDFEAHPERLRVGLLQNGYTELPITSSHAIAVAALPFVHRDPFDRLLLAQAIADDVTLLTADPLLARYPAPVLLA